MYSDASEKAIASVAYLKLIDTDQLVHIGFLFGKAKLAPKHTMPRLELCASVLSIEIAQFVISKEKAFFISFHFHLTINSRALPRPLVEHSRELSCVNRRWIPQQTTQWDPLFNDG